MACKCGSDRIASVGGKVCDSFFAEYPSGLEYEGYVPDSSIGSCDYMEFKYCMDCGQIQSDKFPDQEPVKGEDY